MNPSQSTDRRRFLQGLSLAAGAAALPALPTVAQGADGLKASCPLWEISLAQWSNHRALKSGEMDNLDWAEHTQKCYGIHALEYVNQFFCVGDRNRDPMGYQPKPMVYLSEMRKRTHDLGMRNVLIMCDGVGRLGDPDRKKRTLSVEGHYAWLEAADFLGCHSIRVNAGSDNKMSADEQTKLCTDGLRRLSEYAEKNHGLNVIVENHGGLSSDGAWLAGVMKAVGRENCGTLPDFGNFYLARRRGDAKRYDAEKAIYKGRKLHEDDRGLFYDRYQGIRDLMPYAKGVSAKSFEFDRDGNDTQTDFSKAMKIVRDSGYRGYVGVEFEGGGISEGEGILATKRLLERCLKELG